ncbi:MAG: ImmA/IrrE family metallo-endopeptidase [Phycisphaerales bacterium]
MSGTSPTTQPSQADLFETAENRALLDQLISESRLYKTSKDYKELLEFVVRLRNFAPFNAMLLQVQKPGLSYAASARDWQQRFGRSPKEGARPLLILWPFGPVALVYDVQDTEGRPLPEDVSVFFARGAIDAASIGRFEPLLGKRHIEWCWIDAGDRSAGSIRVVSRAANDKQRTQYRLQVNRNHSPPVQFATLAHELGHLFLGHLGPDRKLKVPERPTLDHTQRELEAESVAYIVCERNGIESKSQTYLSTYIKDDAAVDQLDAYQVMRAAGQVETLLELPSHTSFASERR